MEIAGKMKPCLVPFGGMHQMFCRDDIDFLGSVITPAHPMVWARSQQTTDRRTINIQCLADRNILFSQFCYNLSLSHLFPLFNINTFFQVTAFFLPLDIRTYLFPVPVTHRYCTIRWIPQMPSPKFLLQFWMSNKYLSCMFPFRP